MAMLPEWGAFTQGIIVGCIGAVILIALVLIRRKMEGKPVIVKLSAKTVGTVVLGVVGALVLDADAMSALIDGEDVPVTTREFSILYKLLSYPNKTFI